MRSMEALATFKIFPLNGKMAWVTRSRPCLAEPPAESPSTIKISVSSAAACEQSASLPGSLSRLVGVLRYCTFSSLRFFLSSALSMTYSSNAEAFSGSEDNQWSNESLMAFSTNLVALAEVSLSLVCP